MLNISCSLIIMVSLITGLEYRLEEWNGLWNGQWDVQLVAPLYTACVLIVHFYSFRCQKTRVSFITGNYIRLLAKERFMEKWKFLSCQNWIAAKFTCILGRFVAKLGSWYTTNVYGYKHCH